MLERSELGEVVGARQRHVAAAAGALRGADQALRREHRSASRTVARLTPNSLASTVSFGSRSPGSSSPATTASRS